MIVYVSDRGTDKARAHKPAGDHPAVVCGEGSIHWPLMQEDWAKATGVEHCPYCFIQMREIGHADVALRPV